MAHGKQKDEQVRKTLAHNTRLMGIVERLQNENDDLRKLLAELFDATCERTPLPTSLFNRVQAQLTVAN